MYYTIAFVLYIVIGNLGRWVWGQQPPGTFALDLLVPALWGPGLIAFVDYLDKVSVSALKALRPVLTIDDDTYDHLAYQLANMPPHRALTGSLSWLIIGITVFLLTRTTIYSYFTLWDVIVYAPTFFSAGAVIYHTLHQLSMLSRIFGTIRHPNIFHLEPLYAFSGLSARTAGGWILLSYVTAALLPSSITLGGFGIALIIAISLAILVFILPLLGVHRVLVQEKDHLMVEVNHHLEETVKQIYRCADASTDGTPSDLTATRIDTLDKLLTNLIKARDLIDKISTWPWQPGTIQGIATTILLPIAFWLFQTFIAKLLGE